MGQSAARAGAKKHNASEVEKVAERSWILVSMGAFCARMWRLDK
jgi:hypothetical protein